MTFWDEVTEYFSFEKRELVVFLLTALGIGFIFSFQQWGEATFDAAAGIANLFKASIIAAAVLFLHHGAQKIAGIKRGYYTTFVIWPVGLLLGLYLCFISEGSWYFLIPFGVAFSPISRLKLGRGKQVITNEEKAKIAFAGPLAGILLALIVHAVAPHWTMFINMNIALAIGTMLPIPQLEKLLIFRETNVKITGVHIFNHSRPTFIFAFLFVAIIGIFLKQFSVVGTLLTALVFAAIAAFLWLYAKEL